MNHCGCNAHQRFGVQVGEHARQQPLHPRSTLRGHQVAADHHNGGIQYHGAQTAGDKCTKLLCHRSASGLAVEHKGPVGGVGKQDAEDVVQHIAPAVGGGVAEQIVEQGIQHNIQQGGQHAEDQVGQDLIMLFDPFEHKNIFPVSILTLSVIAEARLRGQSA